MNTISQQDHILTMISMIVAKHECNIEDVDMENKIININGPEDKQVACAMEIASVLEKYLY